ncbi:MAG: hypothetical protein HGA44_06355 [Cellulomonadaceae bacterium]|nr:hypothetical protein [Cellulomonadaceae bacterium]
MRERDRQIAAVAADLGIEATQANPYAPWVIEGRVDGRSFCMRERWDAYTLEVASDDDPTATPWTTGDPTRRITVCTGDATDLGPVDRPPDYRPALTFITVAIRGFLRRRTCDHPHSTGDWFCPRCGESLVDLTHPTAEPASASDDAEKTITSTEPTRMRDGRNLQAVAGANVTLRDAEIPLTDAQADVRDADQTLIAAIGVSLAAGDSWAMIAIAMGTTEAHVRASYGPRVGELQ